MEKMRVSILAVWHVQRVLAKKRDPLTHVLFIEDCLDNDSPLPSEHIWCACMHCHHIAQYHSTNASNNKVHITETAVSQS